jgi:hypothetical protein
MPRLILEQEVVFGRLQVEVEDGGQAAIANPTVLVGEDPEFFFRLQSWHDAETGERAKSKAERYNQPHYHKLLKSMAGKRLRIRIEDLGDIEE